MGFAKLIFIAFYDQFKVMALIVDTIDRCGLVLTKKAQCQFSGIYCLKMLNIITAYGTYLQEECIQTHIHKHTHYTHRCTHIQSDIPHNSDSIITHLVLTLH